MYQYVLYFFNLKIQNQTQKIINNRQAGMSYFKPCLIFLTWQILVQNLG